MTSGVFSGIGGVLRSLTIIIGIIDFGLTVDSFLHHFANEEFFLSVVVICLLLSVGLVILGYFQLNKFHIVDIIFHFIASIFLVIGGILMLYSVVKFGASNSNYLRWYYTERISCGVLGLVNAAIYGLQFWTLVRQK